MDIPLAFLLIIYENSEHDQNFRTPQRTLFSYSMGIFIFEM